jgi:hypothetical protein
LGASTFFMDLLKASDEVKKLIDNGFEYLYEMDDLKFFRMRK